jgi:hypothetical protein
MVSNKKETIDVMISRFNKNQKTNKSQTLKDNHRSPFIDFYFRLVNNQESFYILRNIYLQYNYTAPKTQKSQHK